MNEFLPDPLPANPMAAAAAWLQDAWAGQVQPNPNAMVVATVGDRGEPSARVVLCKEIIAAPGYLVFHTNYHSRKGRELAQHPRAAAVLHWDRLNRQVRIEGPVLQSPTAESDAYFTTRAWQRRIGAWASQQSQPVASRADLMAALSRTAARFNAPDPQTAPDELTSLATNVPRPPHWGGYRLWAESVELWVHGDHRIHDRARWTRTLTPAGPHDFTAGPWSATRLQP